MGRVEWAMWANEHALVSAFCTLVGGILGVAGQFHHWQFCAASIPVSIVILLLEYPRGKREKGNTWEREYQLYFAKVVNAFGPFTKNYYSRFVLYVVFAIPACFVVSTILGGLGIATAAIMYLIAAIKGEEWVAIRLQENPGQVRKVDSFRPPNRPPPRLPEQSSTAKLTPNENQL